MSEKTEQIKKNVVSALERHFDFWGIDKETGLLSKYKIKDKSLRFAGYPHVGDNYADQNVRVVIVGADLGSDELRNENNGFGSYHTFETKKEKLPSLFEKCYFHMAGTYATVIYLLRKRFPKLFSALYDDQASMNDGITALRAIKRLYGVPTEELKGSFAMTNLHKFVTEGREPKAGAENRRWLDSKEEYEFLKDELLALEPTIVVFQELKSGDYLDNTQIEDLKKTLKGCTIVKLRHPSSREKGGYQLYKDIVMKIEDAFMQNC